MFQFRWLPVCMLMLAVCLPVPAPAQIGYHMQGPERSLAVDPVTRYAPARPLSSSTAPGPSAASQYWMARRRDYQAQVPTIDLRSSAARRESAPQAWSPYQQYQWQHAQRAQARRINTPAASASQRVPQPGSTSPDSTQIPREELPGEQALTLDQIRDSATGIDSVNNLRGGLASMRAKYPFLQRAIGSPVPEKFSATAPIGIDNATFDQITPDADPDAYLPKSKASDLSEVTRTGNSSLLKPNPSLPTSGSTQSPVLSPAELLELSTRRASKGEFLDFSALSPFGSVRPLGSLPEGETPDDSPPAEKIDF